MEVRIAKLGSGEWLVADGTGGGLTVPSFDGAVRIADTWMMVTGCERLVVDDGDGDVRTFSGEEDDTGGLGGAV